MQCSVQANPWTERGAESLAEIGNGRKSVTGMHLRPNLQEVGYCGRFGGMYVDLC